MRRRHSFGASVRGGSHLQSEDRPVRLAHERRLQADRVQQEEI